MPVLPEFCKSNENVGGGGKKALIWEQNDPGENLKIEIKPSLGKDEVGSKGEGIGLQRES